MKHKRNAAFDEYDKTHGRSSQPWQGNDMDTYADDLAALVNMLDLKDAIHVGHSSGRTNLQLKQNQN